MSELQRVRKSGHGRDRPHKQWRDRDALMQVCCPACSTEFPVEAGFAEVDGKRLAATLAELEPVVGRALIGYLRLFKPVKTALRMARATKLAREVVELIAPGDVCRDERSGVRRPALPAVWAQGMEQMLQQRDRLSLPLENHNYLRAVVFGLADQADAAAERSREQQLREGRRSTPSAPAPTETPLQRDLAWIEQQLGYGVISPKQAEQERAKVRAKHGVTS